MKDVRLGLVGINHLQADLGLREKIAEALQSSVDRFRFLFPEATFVLLSTCNRTEVYFSSEDPSHAQAALLDSLPEEWRREVLHKFYAFFDIDCFHHLATVTTGLNSAITGETEIQGQVKRTYEGARSSFTLPAEMHELFQWALMVGKLVRREFPLRRGMPDTGGAIVELARRELGPLEGKKLLIIGASEINRQVLQRIAHKGWQVTLCTRSTEEAAQTLGNLSLEILPWHQLDNWKRADCVVLGTRYPGYLVTQEQAAHLQPKRRLLIDLAVPRNVSPLLGEVEGISLYNVDQLQHLVCEMGKLAALSIEAAEELISQKVEEMEAKRLAAKTP